MIWIKPLLFILIIMTVKLIFKFVNDNGDKCLNNMKEILDFTDYLRIYSCHMKMPFDEIYMNYIFKSEKVKELCSWLQKELTNDKNKYEFECSMKTLLNTPDEFNEYFSDIINYYGSTYSDVLDKKLLFTIREMENSMKNFERSHVEKKNLNNRISILVGCLIAIILI